MLSLPFLFPIWRIILFAAALSIVISRTCNVIAYLVWPIGLLMIWPTLAAHI
ncbi:hypothetical protein BDR03DRAFT_960779, partial [Suillus americanus]